MSSFNQFMSTVAIIIGGISLICSMAIGDLAADSKLLLTGVAISCFICAAMLLAAELVRNISHRGK